METSADKRGKYRAGLSVSRLGVTVGCYGAKAPEKSAAVAETRSQRLRNPLQHGECRPKGTFVLTID